VQDTPVNVDLSGVQRQISKSQGIIESDLEQLLGEIAKIQKALNVDFARVMNEMEEVTEALCKPIEFQVTGERRPSSAKAGQMMSKQRTRCRDYWAQTDVKEYTDTWMQTDDAIWKAATRPHKKHRQHARDESEKLKHAIERNSTKVNPKANVFGDEQKMKQQMRRALIQPQYHVSDLYKTKGFVQRIARSQRFENITLLIIFLNAIWIAIDTDLNDATLLINARLEFQIMENLFCTFFFAEIVIRFAAFKHKRDCLKDGWFIFDSVLVFLMVVETWIISVVMLALQEDGTSSSMSFAGEISIFRMARLVKILRISRMARLLRAMPEIVIVLKTIRVAARVVLVFLILWVAIIFLFGVFFRQITDGDDVGNAYFSSVPAAMNTLLLNGLFPENESMVNSLGKSHPALWVLIMLFILIVSLTLMHMLLAVLVELIGVISVAEKEGMTVSYVSAQFRFVLNNLDVDLPLAKTQFQNLLLEPAVTAILAHENVDVMALVDMIDIIYQDIEVEADGGLSFEKLIDLILNMRGSNPATVKDVKEQLLLIKNIVTESISHVLDEFTQDFGLVIQELKELKETQIRALEREDSDEEYGIAATGTLLRSTHKNQSIGLGSSTMLTFAPGTPDENSAGD